MASVTKSAGKAASLVFSREAGIVIRGNLAMLGLSVSGYDVKSARRGCGSTSLTMSAPFSVPLEYFDER